MKTLDLCTVTTKQELLKAIADLQATDETFVLCNDRQLLGVIISAKGIDAAIRDGAFQALKASVEKPKD